ncbi:MAG: decaprenyl-phosphate phosphoribosyltransferase [Betaproteobacteria bacterium]
MTLRDALVALRPAQWVKNAFVLVGTLFGHRWTAADFLLAGLAFAAFCMASSAVYLYNDWIDRDADRLHPTKRLRPIAAGRLGAMNVVLLELLAAAAAFALAAAIGPEMIFLVSAYFGLNIAYTLWLKHVVIADIFAIAGGFQLRLFAGTIGLGIPPSHWLLLCGFALTLLLALGKRRGELLAPGAAGVTRSVLGDYSLPLLDQMLGICATLTLAGYGLYTISPDTAAVHGAADLPYTIPIVTYGVFRYLYALQGTNAGDGDPSRLLFADSHLLCAAVLWIAAVVLIMR